MIPVGILASSKSNAAPSGMVRIKDVNGTGSSVTVTFDEGTALDNTHLLIAIISSQSAITTSGWTDSGAGQGSGATRLQVLARRGDSSVNSIAVTFAGSTPYQVTLLAFSGYVTDTAAHASAATFSAATATTVTPSSLPAVNGFAFACIHFGPKALTWTSAPGYTIHHPAATVTPGHSAHVPYSGSTTSASASFTTSSGRKISAIYELT